MGPMRVEHIGRCSEETEHCSGGPLRIEFSNPLASAADLKAKVHVDPDPQPDWDDVPLQNFATRALLYGKYRAGGTYRVKVDAGIKDALGQEAPATESTVQLDDLLPSLYIGGPEALLESSGDG